MTEKKPPVPPQGPAPIVRRQGAAKVIITEKILGKDELPSKVREHFEKKERRD